VEEQETSTTMLTLSKGFASIEQYDNEGTVNFSPCPDIYSLGATLYNMLTGRVPTESILRATRPLIPPCEINSGISEKTQYAILKAMEIVPANRFQTVDEFLAALDKPVIEKKKKQNVLKQQPVTSNDDTTVVKVPQQVQQKQDASLANEETVIHQPVNVTAPVKKKKRIVVYSILISIFAFAISVFAWNNLGGFGKSNEAVTEIIYPSGQDESGAIANAAVVEEEPGNTEDPVQEEEIVTSIPQNDSQTLTVLPVAEATTPETELPARPDVSLPAAYENYLAAGKDYMQAGEYEEARKEFVQAEKIKTDPEVQALLRECDTHINKIKIAELKNRYEEKMSFGRFIIVRKKSTGLYGAIDEQVREIIPCKYYSVGVSDTGRAFEREDGLFDIYNPYGVMIGEGLTNY